MIHKFTVVGDLPKVKDTENPVLYKVWFSTKFYIHKGKELSPSLDKLLYDVFRGLCGSKYSEQYERVVKYCKQYPALNKVTVELISNDIPAKILKKEEAFYKDKNNPNSLLNFESGPYKPEWMLRDKFTPRCEEVGCIKSGTVNKKKINFNFCPNCGHAIRPEKKAAS